jgi:NAD(P)-dependent dehydrogenase (short-subunit alcohol dehydrogenase family)
MSDPLFSFDDQVVLVTGGSRGIGRAIAQGFLDRGATVILAARTADELENAAREMSGGDRVVLGRVCDVSVQNSVNELVQNIIAEFGHIDTLVNSAGVNKRKAALDYTEEEYDTILDTNLKGAFFQAQAVGRHMLERKSGSQIHIGSLQGDKPHTNLMPYCASKAGLEQMVRALAVEWGKSAVRINNLAPGFITTDLTRKLWEDETLQDWGQTNIPRGRTGTPEDLVGTALFLASEASAYLSGQTLYVDGGFTAGRHWPFPA